MLEREVEKKLVQGVKRLGGLCLKWVSPGYSGVPDRIVITPSGHTFYVELKTDRGRLSERQKYVHKEFLKRNVTVYTLYGAEDVQKILLGDWKSDLRDETLRRHTKDEGQRDITFLCSCDKKEVPGMNAQELTKEVVSQENRIITLENELRYLRDTVDKLTIRISDLEIDVRQR